MESTEHEGDRCGECAGSTVIRPVPDRCRGLLAEDPATVRVCERCLRVTPAPGSPVTRGWDPASVSGGLPREPHAAVALALGVTFFSSLAMHRRELEAVTAYLEHEGVDALLAFDRIGTAPELEPAVDVVGRRDQLAQLMAD